MPCSMCFWMTPGEAQCQASRKLFLAHRVQENANCGITADCVVQKQVLYRRVDASPGSSYRRSFVLVWYADSLGGSFLLCHLLIHHQQCSHCFQAKAFQQPGNFGILHNSAALCRTQNVSADTRGRFTQPEQHQNEVPRMMWQERVVSTWVMPSSAPRTPSFLPLSPFLVNNDECSSLLTCEHCTKSQVLLQADTDKGICSPKILLEPNLFGHAGFASLYQLAVVMQQGLLQAGADHVIWRCKNRHD